MSANDFYLIGILLILCGIGFGIICAVCALCYNIVEKYVHRDYSFGVFMTLVISTLGVCIIAISYLVFVVVGSTGT